MVVLPVVALFIRLSIGARQIRSNYCDRKLRILQFGALVFAILIFFFADFLIVLCAFIPKNRRHPPPEDIPIYVGALVLYVFLVLVAMFPGRSHARASID